jgi:hypothetical protein
MSTLAKNTNNGTRITPPMPAIPISKPAARPNSKQRYRVIVITPNNRS